MPYNKPFSKEVDTNTICNYGCGKLAKYIFRCGKYCCSKHYNSCLNKRIMFSQTADHKTNARKSLQMRTDLGITKSSQIKGGKTRVKQGHYKKLAIKMQEHWLETPWNNNPKWRNYPGTQIMVQSTLEESFLRKLQDQYGIQWIIQNIKRGPAFYYIDPLSKNRRLYLSDFILDNIIYEIKGSYTWNRRGKDIILEQRNKAKLQAAKDSGYKVILVLDNREMDI